MEEYRLIRSLGEGTFGRVYEAQHKQTQRTVAIKLVHSPSTRDPNSGTDADIATSNRELQALQLCRHPSVIALHGHFVHQHSLALVLDYCNCGDLAQLALRCQSAATTIPLRTARLIGHQLLTALAHIHSLGVLHRDIKPSNVLLSLSTPARLAVCLADFGQAHIDDSSGRPRSPPLATRWYKAPELLLPSDVTGSSLYGCGVDVWAAGCVMAEWMNGAVLLPGNSDVEQLSRIAAMCGRQGGEQGWEVVEHGKGLRALLGEEEVEQRLEVGAHADAQTRRDLLDLLDCMLQWSPVKRITAQQALNHAFFTRTALTSEATDVGALLPWLDQTQAELTSPSVSTAELLQQPLTMEHIFSCCPPRLATQNLQQPVNNTTAT